MHYKIKKSFRNSQFYRNYNEIDYVILKFQTIKNVYTEYKNKLNNLLPLLNKNKLSNKILFDKFDTTNFENKSNNLCINEISLKSYQKILDEKIKISKDINDDFIKTVKIGNIKNVDILIKNGADVHAKDDRAIRWSSQNGHIEVVRFLIEKGADIHADDDYALRCSSQNGHIELVKFWVEKGANIHANDDYALRCSSKNGHIEVVKFLINTDLEYFCNNEFVRNIVIRHNLIEFYEKFKIKKN